MAGVEAEGDRGAVFGAKAAVGAEDEEFGSEDASRVPAHASVLAEAEEISGGLSEEHLGGDGQSAGGTGRMRGHGRESEVGGFKNGGEGYVLNDCSCCYETKCYADKFMAWEAVMCNG